MTVPAQPDFGAALPITPSPATLDFLALRRSASPFELTAPAPGGETLETLLRLAARVPDHGKLFPWRFIILEGEAKAAFAAQLDALAAVQPDAAKAIATLGKLKTPPLTVAVISTYAPGKIPEWEQRLSAGAVCMNLLIAAQAMGYGANWITDWYAFDPRALALLDLAEGEQVAGYVHIGTATEAPLERVRPDIKAITTRWVPK